LQKEYSFNKKRLEKKEYRDVLEDTAAAILGEKVKFKFSVEGDKEQEPEAAAKGTLAESLQGTGVEIVDE